MSEPSTREWITPIERRFGSDHMHLSDTIVSRITDRIRDNRLRQGDRINATQIAGDLGGSRGSVREALFRLECVGVIDSEPGRYTRVAVATSDVVSWVAEIAGIEFSFAARYGITFRGKTDVSCRARAFAIGVGECRTWSDAAIGPALHLGHILAESQGDALHFTRVRELTPAIQCFLGNASDMRAVHDVDLATISMLLVSAIDSTDGVLASRAMRQVYMPSTGQ